MPALAQETAQLAARVAEECKSLRTLINANNENLNALNTSAKGNLVAAVNEVWTITQSGVEWDNIQSKPLTFAPSAHKTSHATGGSDELTAADIGAAPTSHTHTASQISDSTTTGRALMTAANASAARTTLELGNAALATTSTGGNGLDDSGKVATYNFYGQLVSNGLEIKSGSYTTTITGSSSANVTIGTPSSGGYFAVTLSTSGIPDNLVTSGTKTTPIDADSVLMTDSEAAGTPAKRITFANFWTWILSKLGGNLTIGGTKTWSGDASFTSSTRPTSSGTGAPEANSLITLTDSDDRSIFQDEHVWCFTAAGAPAGCVVLDSTITANAVAIYNYTSTTYPLNIMSCAGDPRESMSFDRRHKATFSIYISNAIGAGVGYVVFGETYNQNAVNAPSKKSFGLVINNNGIALWVHNGTTLTTGSATAITATNTLHRITIEYWNGTLSGTMNGIALNSATNGPSGLGAGNDTAISFQAKAGATNERCRFGVMYGRSLTTSS